MANHFQVRAIQKREQAVNMAHGELQGRIDTALKQIKVIRNTYTPNGHLNMELISLEKTLKGIVVMRD